MTPRRVAEAAGSAVLSKATLVPMGLAMVFVTGAFYVGGKVTALDGRLASLEVSQKTQAAAVTTLSTEISGLRADIGQIDLDMELRTTNRWTNLQMHQWSRDLARENPELSVPSVLDYPAPVRSAATALGRMILPD